MTVFNTVEDVNGTQFDNQGFWWYELDTSVIDPTGDAEFTDVKVDFLTISKESYTSNRWLYTVEVNNDLWTKGFYITRGSSTDISINIISTSPLKFTVGASRSIRFHLLMGNVPYSDVSLMSWKIAFSTDFVQNAVYRRIGKTEMIAVKNGGLLEYIPFVVDIGYNRIVYDGVECGYVLVKLRKTDFQFTCNQQLIVGEVNTVQLGTATDYKPNGDLVGDYETKLSVLYNNKIIPVNWNAQLNDYSFDLDLTDLQEEKKIRFKVIVEANDVLNHTETDVVLNANYEGIDTLSKLQNLFKIGGTGRLTSNITVTSDLTLSKSVNLIGNNKAIDLSTYKIVVPSDLTLKVNEVSFSNGVNSIQQEPNSNVELTGCNFTDCTGFGSVIDCQVDLASLDETDDFTTKLTECNITNCDMAILSGGNLEVNGCNVQGKISNKNYPYFLYQTDGNATILNSEFNLTDETVYDYDIEFNSCIFVCGETATINGYSHTELQQNNITAFFETQRNTSKIDVQYYYSLIEDTVHLQSSKGYCHSVSNIDYVYKTNITLSRGE